MIIFGIATIINVLLSTIRSILTIKGSPFIASIANAFCYGFYSIVIVLTADDSLPLWFKVLATAVANFIGVFIVKIIEKKITKDKLWKIEFTINRKDFIAIEDSLKVFGIPYYYNEFGKHILFSVFAGTQAESAEIAKIIKRFDGKYFITENRGLLY